MTLTVTYKKHGGPPTFQRAEVPTSDPILSPYITTPLPHYFVSLPIRPIAAKRPWCHNWQSRENPSGSGETTPLLPVSKDSERTSGTVRSWSPSQVVPGSSVLTLDRSAGWLAFQQRVGKAGSVRLG